MITVAVSIILIGLAVPSFQVVFNSSRINTQANEFVAALQVARMEAVRRNARVVVCPSTNQTSCTGGNPTSWTGWLAFVDDGGFSEKGTVATPANVGNGAVDTNETVLRAGLTNTTLKVNTSSNISGTTGGAIVFRSDGLARDNAGNLLKGIISVCVKTAHPPQNRRDVTINTGGRISVASFNGGGNCNTPSNPP